MIAKMDKKEKPQQARPPTPPAITPLSQHQTKAILQAIKKNRPICLSAYPISELSLIEHFIDLGTNAHTPSRSSRVRQTEDVSTHLACMYGIFHHVLNERLSLGSPIAKEYDIESALATCEANLNILLQDGGKTTFEPGLGSVLALTLGALRPHLSPAVSSRLLGKAAEQCLALGWNVDISHANSSSSRRLFWSVYMLEKQMSLALGRPSVFRDGDVNVRLPILARKEGVRNWDEVFLSRVGLARIQGVVLGILYEDGKDSKMKEEKERGEDREIDDYEKRVGKAATELEEWFGLLDSLSADGVEHRRLFNLQRQILEVRYYSTYTALLRGPLCSPPASTSTSYKPVPPGLMPENGRNQAHIKPECFKTARATIKTYIRACNAYKIILTMSPSPSPFARIYSPLTDWTLLTPLLHPIIITTLLSIASTNLEDVSLLSDLAEALHILRLQAQPNPDSSPPHPSEPGPETVLERLYTLTVSFSKIAMGLVKRRLEGSSNVQRWSDTWVEERESRLDSAPITRLSRDRESALFIPDGEGESRAVAGQDSGVEGEGEGEGEGDSMSVLRQVMDEDIRDFVGEEGAREVFAVLEGFMRGEGGVMGFE